MKRRSPTLEGFRAMFSQPSFGLAEITWRWSFGGAAWLLIAALVLEYFDTLPVSRGELLLLRTGQPILISQAMGHIFRGSAPRLVMAGMVLGSALSLLWIWIASLGRWTTLKALASYFQEDTGDDEKVFVNGGRIRAIAGLNFFRAAATVAALVGCVGAVLLGGAVSPDKDPSPGSAMLVFLTIFLFVAMAWSAVNWFLSLAPLFVVAEGRDTFGAMAATVRFFRERMGPVAAASTWFGLAHLAVFFIASSVAAFPLAFVSVLPGGVVLGGVILITLPYFAVADILYMGRLAAYMAILRLPEVAIVTPMFQSLPPSGIQQRALNAQRPDAVDPDEVILSDIPLTPDPAQGS